MQEILLAILLVIFLFWFFNIKEMNRCIRLTSNCDDNTIVKSFIDGH